MSLPRTGGGARRVIGLSLIAVLLAGCSGNPAPGTVASGWELVRFETSSWGRVVSGWSIGRAGEGAWWIRENTNGDPGPVGPFQVTYHEFDAGPAGFDRLAMLLAALPDIAPVATDCTDFRSDDLYGTVRLTSRATTVEHAWNRGCEDPAYRALLGPLQSADSLVASWGRAAPAVRVERFDADGRGVGMDMLR